MSAYGTVTTSKANSNPLLQSTIWPIPVTSNQETSLAFNNTTTTHLTIHHLTLATATSLSGLVSCLHGWFSQEVDEGMTYPQEGEIRQDAFEAYFFAGDVFVAIIGCELDGISVGRGEKIEEKKIKMGIEQTRCGRTWEECIAGFYYVKPNYPGRSSHICNAGFVVPPSRRSHKYGTLLARSFLHYAPQLGYEASVFNLVYVNNAASIRIWESLDFKKVGCIPRAGRLKCRDGQGEEYVDAWVFYKRFES